MSMPHTGHILKKFDEELGTLRDRVLHMGGRVEEQLRRAVDALERGDVELARQVIAGDREIDRIELAADEEIAHLLAKRTPLGIDLRTVLTLAKTVTDLERIGDEAKKLARTARDLAAGGVRPAYLAALAELGRGAVAILHDALDALVRLDLDRVAEIGKADKGLDRAFDLAVEAITAHLLSHPAQSEASVQALFAAKGLERIGDHAKNISQYVVYLVQGRDIRHPKANPNVDA